MTDKTYSQFILFGEIEVDRCFVLSTKTLQISRKRKTVDD